MFALQAFILCTSYVIFSSPERGTKATCTGHTSGPSTFQLSIPQLNDVCLTHNKSLKENRDSLTSHPPLQISYAPSCIVGPGAEFLKALY